MKIGYLGADGSYSSLALKKFDKNADAVGCHSFYAVFESLKNGNTDKIILPIENSINGNVTKVLDLLIEYDFFIQQELVLEINHKLIMPKGDFPYSIERIISHEQALSQCGKFITLNYPKCEQVCSESTSKAFELAVNTTDAVIASGYMLPSAFEIVNENISDVENNVTRFIVVSKVKKENKNAKRVYLAFSLSDKSGALLNSLGFFAKYNVNMTKIESRPLKRNLGEYVFFIEIEKNDNYTLALSELQCEVSMLKILGEY